MTPLRQKMLDMLTLKGCSPLTSDAYIRSITQLAKYYHRSPDTLDVGEIEAYFVYLLRDRKLAPNSVLISVNAVRFLFTQVLGRPKDTFSVHCPKRVRRIPELLTRDEVRRIILCTHNLKHYTMLAICYASGLRVSELLRLQLRDVDRERHILHVRLGKGNKDREALLTDGMLTVLEQYWVIYRPHAYLFPRSPINEMTMSSRSIQKALRNAKEEASINKRGGIHSLRHAYATHQLEAGMPIYKLQRVLGHSDINTTLQYVHWLPHYRNRGEVGVDLLDPALGVAA